MLNQLLTSKRLQTKKQNFMNLVRLRRKELNHCASSKKTVFECLKCKFKLTKQFVQSISNLFTSQVVCIQFSVHCLSPRSQRL